ncbi:hypothetical protein [Micromonospora craniellae]|uniref:O-antigen ligase domain-containing protein n=1 Tax=Micromonospora craniellae TaxID=2294034 RepID=A0A372G1G4_9ACTN|nr:hypothetical protein [Micromonospora craniellae]QOC92726.1 hypothetical protein ID554_02915 [Micromonospora craniellae]RFS46872.1 hypothetical protein D0Q02_08820 [Micromonospora craniellae]
MPTHRRRIYPGQRAADCAVVLLVAASFGPYVVSGVRTEQLAVCAVAGIAFLVRARRLPSAPAPVVALAALLVAYPAVAAVASVGDAHLSTGLRTVGFWAGLDNLLLPAIILAAGYLIVSGDVDRLRLVRFAAGTLVTILAANAILAYAMLMDPGAYDHVLTAWWSGDTGTVTTAERAATMGRYSGIFNQPAEAGVMYSVGLVAAVFMLRRRPVLLAAAGVLLTIGGLLTASKIFLLVGLPVAVWQTWAGSPWRTRVGAALAVTGVLAVFDHQARRPDSPIGGMLLDAWLAPGEQSGSLLSLYSARRFGENSTLADAAGIVFTHSPWIGFGMDGLRIAYDSAWVEALVMAGLIGVVAQTAILTMLVVLWWRSRRWADRAVVRFGAGLLVVVVVGSLGLPTTTVNRVSTVVWLLVALLLVARPAPPTPAPATAPRASRRVVPASRRPAVSAGQFVPAGGVRFAVGKQAGVESE